MPSAGHGGGWYDRSFAFRHDRPAPPWLVGAAFAVQQVESLPVASWDVPVDAICTEDGTLFPPLPRERMTARKRYWLMKSERTPSPSMTWPRSRSNPGTGAHYQARNFMRDGMQVGDGILFYHSNTKVPGIVGLATVASPAYPDDTQFDPKSDYTTPRARAKTRAGCWWTWPSTASSSR